MIYFNNDDNDNNIVINSEDNNSSMVVEIPQTPEPQIILETASDDFLCKSNDNLDEN